MALPGIIQRVDPEKICELFNQGRYWERAQAGELTQIVIENRHPSLMKADEPFCTRSQAVSYRDVDGNEIVRVHQYGGTLKPRSVSSSLVRVEIVQVTGQSTFRAELFTMKDEVSLGSIAWEPRWRQYAFIPAQGARYTVRVLRAIDRQVGIMMRSWERQNHQETAQ